MPIRNLENPPRETGGPSRQFLRRYGCAVASVALATGVRLLLDPVLGPENRFPILLFAILLTAWYGGAGPALAAVVLSALSADYFLILPRGSFVGKDAAQYWELIFYMSVGAGIATAWKTGLRPAYG